MVWLYPYLFLLTFLTLERSTIVLVHNESTSYLDIVYSTKGWMRYLYHMVPRHQFDDKSTIFRMQSQHHKQRSVLQLNQLVYLLLLHSWSQKLHLDLHFPQLLELLLFVDPRRTYEIVVHRYD